MGDAVTYALRDQIALVTIDDGKANALSPDVILALHDGLDRAATDGAGAIVIAGRPGMLSGGFDLNIMRGGDWKAITTLVTDGGELFTRIYACDIPVVAACPGHAVAAGALLLLGSHFRVGAEGEFRIVLIETAIGMVLPDWAVELSRLRLSMRHVQPAAIESRVYDPATALDAGFLDRVVAPDQVIAVAIEEANRLAALPASAYAGNAKKVRGPGIATLEAAVAADRAAI